MRIGRNSVSFMYKGIFFVYIIPFGEQQPWMPEIPQLERFNKKTGLPKWSISFYNVLNKNDFFKLSEGLPPTTGVVELWKKTSFAMNTHGNRYFFWKNDDYCHWAPIFYECNSARNWVPFMYNGIYYIRKSLWGAATLDVWRS